MISGDEWRHRHLDISQVIPVLSVGPKILIDLPALRNADDSDDSLLLTTARNLLFHKL